MQLTKIFSLLFLAISHTGATGADDDSTPELALGGYDIVTYYTEQQPQKGSDDYSYVYNGRLYLFTSASNRNAFQSDPARLEPDFGHTCAFALAHGDIVEPDPAIYTITGNKLQLFADKSSRAKWLKDESKLYTKAKARWQQKNKSLSKVKVPF